MEDVFQQSPGVNGAAQSKWIDLLKVILTVGIVCRHATMADAATELPAFQSVTQIIVHITALCVPLFFVLSGYLFFLKVPQKPDVSYFIGKLKKRVFSLLIPYVIANLIAFGCYWAAGRWFPMLVSGFFGDRLNDPIFVFWSGPVNLSLWFIRELIVCCLLSPLVWLLVRYTRVFGVIALGLLWAFHIGPAPIFFFTLGAWPAIRRLRIDSVASWIEQHPVRIATSWRAWCYFIYLYHYLLLIGVKKALVLTLKPSSSLGYLACYLASILIVLIVLTLIYKLLRRFLPKTTTILIGGK